MNLGDPQLELIDPTPNVYLLFIHFDKLFFWTKLESRAIVKWSKRMYSCAGVCSYEGRGGLCTIALSEPLLKLRPRKDLIETLLHEMIHAFLFVTNRDRDRDGHGPNFQAHMHRINKAAGLNISIYHDFHDEVKLYQTHWWRCNGPCQARRPHFGIVRRSMNRAPSQRDFWWEDHKRKCGGTFVKIKEPEKPGKKPAAKPKADITKYIINNNKTIDNNKTINNNIPQITQKRVLKDSNNIPAHTKSNSSSTFVVTKKEPIFNPRVPKPPELFSGKGQTIGIKIQTDRRSIDSIQKVNSVDVAETVRNIWANKQLPSTFNNNKITPNSKRDSIVVSINITKPTKQKAEPHVDSPPMKVKKIDDYFTTTANSVLKDVYGQNFSLKKTNNDKIIAVTTKSDLVACPICNANMCSSEINKHLDECLNKEVIETLSKENQEHSVSSQNVDNNNFRNKVGDYDNITIKTENNFRPPYTKTPIFTSQSSDIEDILNIPIKIEKESDIKHELDNSNTFDPNDVNKVKSILKKINYDNHVRKVPKEEPIEIVDVGFLPSFLDDIACKIENPVIKLEPGTSKDIISQIGRKCACCGNKIDKPLEQHLDECLAFFSNNITIPQEGASTSFANDTIVIDDDDDDVFDETQSFNQTGTKCPCPCCLEMVEQDKMNNHLDSCLT